MQTNKFLGSVLIIAGTSIGAGMLALPVSTAAYGFLPSIFLFILCWLQMLVVGLLVLEVNLWLKPGANIVSMAAETLGTGGKIVAWVTYLMLFYALIAAYMSGMGDLVSKTTQSQFQVSISNGTGSLLLVLLVGTAVYLGMKTVDYLNRVFFFGKLLTYAAVVIAIIPLITLAHLTHINLNKMWLALPIVVTSFGFQNTIPSLRVYLNEDVKKLRLAIIIGSSIPLLIYIIWELVIVGVVPIEGKEGLLNILSSGQPATGLAASLDHHLNKSWISTLFRTFTFCAIITSFIGVSFSLYDFLIDSFRIKRTFLGRLLAIALTFTPPLIFAFLYPQGFIFALGYAGIFVAILLGILPVLMYWRGRHIKHLHSDKALNSTTIKPIIKLVLVLVFLFSLVIIGAQLAS